MKKGKIFSILTSIAMVFSLSMPLNVFAEDEPTGVAQVGGGDLLYTN